MRIVIDVHPHKRLSQAVSQVNNALAFQVRKLKKFGGPWPIVSLVSVGRDQVVYEVQP